MRWKSITIALVAFALGFGAAWFLCGPFQAPQTFVTTSDLDLGASYFFKEPRVQGVLKAGSELTVVLRKGYACYLEIHTVIDEDKLAQITRPGEGAD